MEVLIVDDDSVLREILAAVVRSAVKGASIVTVKDLETAFLRLAHHAPPAFALLDLGLPGQSGLDALKRFRWKFPGVPVVVVSANEDPRAIRVALDAGAAGYIPKSSPADVMVEAIRRVSTGGTYAPPSVG